MIITSEKFEYHKSIFENFLDQNNIVQNVWLGKSETFSIYNSGAQKMIHVHIVNEIHKDGCCSLLLNSRSENPTSFSKCKFASIESMDVWLKECYKTFLFEQYPQLIFPTDYVQAYRGKMLCLKSRMLNQYLFEFKNCIGSKSLSTLIQLDQYDSKIKSDKTFEAFSKNLKKAIEMAKKHFYEKRTNS